MVINNATHTLITIDNEAKSPTTSQKNDESSMLDELVKGMREMKLKLARLEEKGQPSMLPAGQRPQTKEGSVHKCIWCDSTDHGRKDCDSFSEALKRRLVFFKDGKIHLIETGLPTCTNFGKGGMKKLVDDMASSHAISIVEAASYGLKFWPLMVKEFKSFKGAYEEIGDLWPNAMELAAKGKLTKETLHEAAECIQMETVTIEDEYEEQENVHRVVDKSGSSTRTISGPHMTEESTGSVNPWSGHLRDKKQDERGKKKMFEESLGDESFD
ncbi:hypothetical protein L7F22_012205 [Adiantum nelumboides]|nr:hypothetical protein [Adiantum nelumboides]